MDSYYLLFVLKKLAHGLINSGRQAALISLYAPNVT